jgi:hypothetical protein
LEKPKTKGNTVVANDKRFPVLPSTTSVALWDDSIPGGEEDAIGKFSGWRRANRLEADTSEDFGGLNLTVIALPVRKVELNRERSFRGLLATFSSR